jgi:nondiscriminating glutamyl-tRNA synthetase
MSIITRFAPSPTGFLHVGGARTAIFNYIYTKQNKGKILLRIEDTDKERNKPEYTTGILEAFKWLGITFDETKIQSDNLATHKKYLQRLLDSGHIYISKEKVVEEGQRDEVIRFRNPNKEIVVDDLIKGQVKFDTTELGDFVIAKSIEEPIFHFANVVDDISMGITHVIRGEEHLSNTPRQILIWEAIGEKPRPVYGHIPLILSDTREKISKRKHGEMVSVEYYRDRGYLPEALINFLAFLGWNPSGTEEIFSLDRLIEKFDIHKVQKAGAIFNPEKLKWFNREYIQKLSNDEFENRSKQYIPNFLAENLPVYNRAKPLIREKISVFSEIGKMFDLGGELNFVKEIGDYSADLLLWKKSPSREESRQHLTMVKGLLNALADNDFTTEGVKSAIWSYAEEKGRGNVLWPLRVSLTGQEKSPDPFMSAYILGKKESIKRIDSAIAKLV